MPSVCRVSVWIAHYYKGSSQPQPYGSLRASQRPQRALALARALSAWGNLNRRVSEPVLSPAAGGWQIAHADARRPPILPAVEVDLHVCVSGNDFLGEAIDLHSRAIHLHRLDVEQPMHLPAATRDALVYDDTSADLWIYCEDDLIPHDPVSIDKWVWFSQLCGHRAVLMPHRYEPLGKRGKAFIDGAISPDYLQFLAWPRAEDVSACFWPQQSVDFHMASNPHAGCFAISDVQRRALQQFGPLPREGFVGPLESVATATVGQFWPIYKPSWAHRHFLLIEHGHPVFRGSLETLPMLDDPAA